MRAMKFLFPKRTCTKYVQVLLSYFVDLFFYFDKRINIKILIIINISILLHTELLHFSKQFHIYFTFSYFDVIKITSILCRFD